MDWPTIILLGLSVNTTPTHIYSYSYTEAYGVRAAADGTVFYDPKHPQFDVRLLLLFDDYTAVALNLDTGFYSPKYTEYPSVSANVERRFDINQNTTFSIFATINYEGKKVHRSCLDRIGREFHCYHGVVPTSPLYAFSFEDTARILSSRNIGLQRIGFSLQYRF
jgi:hypothetical protein